MKTSELANSHPAAMRKLGSSIRTLRKQAGYTIDELATIAGISAKTLARIEKAESSVTVNKLFVLSEALGIAPDELIRPGKPRLGQQRDGVAGGGAPRSGIRQRASQSQVSSLLTAPVRAEQRRAAELKPSAARLFASTFCM